MRTLFRPAITLFVIISVVTGLLYPFVTTQIAKMVFPAQAAGSLIQQGDHVVGSALIGQNFSGASYFWGRPSATSPYPYNAAASSGSNLGPTNPALVDAVKARVAMLRAAHPDETGPVPVDLVTASASGLDPHISPQAAYYQVGRIAKARRLNEQIVTQLISEHIEAPQWALFGEPRINVLQLNLALDEIHP